jgi:hypothetical protein
MPRVVDIFRVTGDLGRHSEPAAGNPAGYTRLQQSPEWIIGPLAQISTLVRLSVTFAKMRRAAIAGIAALMH